jgi:alpha-glucosidase
VTGIQTPLLLLSLLAAFAFAAPGLELRSPGGDLVVNVEVKDVGGERACPVYRVTYRGREILKDSRLGLELEPNPLVANVSVAGEGRTAQDSTWQPVCGERSTVRDHYNQVAIDLREIVVPHRLLRVTFRAYDEGVAFCYTLPEQPGVTSVTVARELTQFAFTGDHAAWAVYRAQADYSGGPVPLSQVKPGAERPLTVRIADDLYVALTDARSADYARTKFQPAAGVPYTLETLLDGERGRSGKVTGNTPLTTPWRVVMVADSPGRLLEQDDLVLNLNDPCAIADTSWIKPGKVMRETTLTTAGGKACVDFCVRRGLQYILLDAGWYGPERDDKSDARAVDPKRAGHLDLREVIRYGKERGIGVILYVNYRALVRQVDELLPLYEQWGVRGVKFGFVDVGSQQATRFVYDGVRKAAAHHLMVDVHDEFRDTGYRRTYPNLMTVEGVFGNEEFPTAAHNAALPFTRYLTGPADYTFCWYSNRLKVTRAHQLAISTIYFSPWQVLFWYDRPAMYDGDGGLDYWKRLPTCWDETRVLHGEIGKYVTVARRKGREWFVGTIRAEGGDVEIPLSFLDPGREYTATVYGDDAGSKRVRVTAREVNRETVLKATISANGGQAVRVAPK